MLVFAWMCPSASWPTLIDIPWSVSRFLVIYSGLQSAQLPSPIRISHTYRHTYKIYFMEVSLGSIVKRENMHWKKRLLTMRYLSLLRATGY